MDLKKITAFVMLALLVIPGFGMAMGEESPTDNPEENAAVGLRCAIDRAYNFIEKINATVERLGDEGYVVQDVEDNLTDAELHLEGAETLLDSLEFEAAAQEFSVARMTMGGTMGWLHSTAKKVKLTRTERFMEQFQRQIQNVNGTLLRLRERLGAGVTAGVRGVLTSSMNRLQQLRRRMADNGDLEAALDELEGMVGEIEEGIGGLGENYANEIRSVNRFEARIRVLNATANRLRQRGMDVPEMENLTVADSLLDDVVDLLGEGEMGAAEGIFGEIEDLVSGVSGEIRAIRKGRQNKGGKGKGKGS